MALPKGHVVTLLGVTPHMQGGVTMLAEAIMVAEATMLPEATMVEVALNSTLPHALLLPLLHKVQTVNPLVTTLSTMWVRLQVPHLPNGGILISALSATLLGTTSTTAGS